jgi:predicted dithiol-disulfide oxidoreductase (DUF899 family)
MHATKPRLSEIERLEAEIEMARGRLAELRRVVPPTPVPDYTLEGWSGPVRLSSLFRDKADLIVVHNMGKGCVYCTLWADGLNGVVPHLESRAGFVVVSPDPPAVQKEFALGRGWRFRMASGAGSTFIQDMGFRGEKSWVPGVSTFRRDEDGSIHRIAKDTFGPGDPYAGIWHLFALLRDGAGDWAPKFQY